MSNPVAIPRASSTTTSDAHSGSPTGLYVPVHKRANSAPSSSSSSRSDTPRRSLGTTPTQKRARSPRIPRTSADTHHPLSVVPTRARLPFVYDIMELLALASSPLVGLSPAQREHLDSLRQFIAPQPNPTPPLSSVDKAVRRRPGHRRASVKKSKLTADVHADVESLRKRHGNWNWQAHADVEESWRHAPLVGVHA